MKINSRIISVVNFITKTLERQQKKSTRFMSLKAKRECSKTNMITINICIYRVEKVRKARLNVRKVATLNKSFSHIRHDNQ